MSRRFAGYGGHTPEMPRRGRSGLSAEDWRRHGEYIGELMQKRKEKGYCTGCEFWGTDEAALAQLEKVWGKSDEKFIKENSSCQLSASDWNSLCPHANDPD